MDRPAKPLNAKAYGHIPHLPGSRLGPGDHKVSEGQERISTRKARDRHDRIIVQEKTDGACMAIARLDDRILALGRAGYLAFTSPFRFQRMFGQWVAENEDRFRGLLEDGERIVGEWLVLAHGTKYDLPHEPFVAFDIMRGTTRTPGLLVYERLAGALPTPRLIHEGTPISIEDVVRQLEPSGHGAIDPVEGAVWRVERRGVVDFLAKWVRQDKVDGKYLADISGGEEVWNLYRGESLKNFTHAV